MAFIKTNDFSKYKTIMCADGKEIYEYEHISDIPGWQYVYTHPSINSHTKFNTGCILGDGYHTGGSEVWSTPLGGTVFHPCAEHKNGLKEAGYFLTYDQNYYVNPNCFKTEKPGLKTIWDLNYNKFFYSNPRKPFDFTSSNVDAEFKTKKFDKIDTKADVESVALNKPTKADKKAKYTKSPGKLYHMFFEDVSTKYSFVVIARSLEGAREKFSEQIGYAYGSNFRDRAMLRGVIRAVQSEMFYDVR